MLFRQIIFYALLVGILSGLVLTVAQFWQVIPIIQNAERYENATMQITASVDGHSDHDHSGHEHSADAWSPQDGIERTSFTLLSNVLTAIGMALLLLFAIVSSNKSVSLSKLNWQYGLLWGAAGYAVFYLVPSIGVPPGIPGANEAPLEARQQWWLLAVTCTAIGLAVVAFGKSPWRWAGIGILALPYLIGAPPAPSAAFINHSPRVINELTELAHQFISATAIAYAAFWLALGLAAVWAARRMICQQENLEKSIYEYWRNDNAKSNNSHC